MAEPFSNFVSPEYCILYKILWGRAPFQDLKIQDLAQSATKCEPILYPGRCDFYVSSLHHLLFTKPSSQLQSPHSKQVLYNILVLYFDSGTDSLLYWCAIFVD